MSFPPYPDPEGPMFLPGHEAFDEDAWWGTAANTFHEEQKQIVYASRMGLLARWNVAHPPEFDLGGRSVMDIGGGPVSLLLKCANRGQCVVVDPGNYPDWVLARYTHCGIAYVQMEGEEVSAENAAYDEAWIYNVLQHVSDPERVIANARHAARTVRLFEWIGIDPYPGHPQRLEREDLDEWLGAPGFTSLVNEDGAVGNAYYGVFRGI